MSQTRSAARSIVTAVAPRPTSCCPGASAATGRMYSAILRRVRAAFALLLALVVALGAGCARDAPPRHHAGPAPAPVAAPAGSSSSQDPPAANERLSASPRRLAARTTFVSGRLRASIDGWPPPGRGPRAPPPLEVQLRALYQQRVMRRLAHRPRLARATLPLLPRWLRGE